MAFSASRRHPLAAAVLTACFGVVLALLAGADAPTPTPTPLGGVTLQGPVVKSVPLPIPPPLSLSECQNILTSAIAQVPDPPAQSGDPVAAQRMVRSVENYLKFRDDLHTSLANYQWQMLKSAKVENNPGEVDRDTFTFNPPVRLISALGFEAVGGDVWLHRVLIYDENGLLRDTHTFDQPRLLQQLLPRREVFHLWRRSTISKIVVEYSAANPGPLEPRVVVLGGMTEEREYIKTAIYHLSAANESLAHHDWKSSRASVVDARREIQAYVERRQAE